MEVSRYDAIVALFTEDVSTLFIVSSDDWRAVSRKDLPKVALGRAIFISQSIV